MYFPDKLSVKLTFWIP